MDAYERVRRGASEVVTEEELKEVMRGKPTVYCGYEPSGKIHCGHALTAFKLLDFLKEGARVIVLLADLHAYLNHKGTLEEIREITEYNKKCFVGLGLDPGKTEYRLGSEFQLSREYMMDVLRMSTDITLLRARRAMAEIARKAENPDVAQVLYPLMQAVDIAHLGVDVAVGGEDQRKVHMMAREKLEKLGYKKPVCVHMPLLHGLDGDVKMSSSKGNFIAVDDTPEEIRKKVQKAFCPPKVVEGNPVVEYAEHLVLSRLGGMEVRRSEKHGGTIFLREVRELRERYSSGELHPADLKPAVAEGLIELFSPVREYLKG
ncbi:MAG: tyrosine--tRNA ligase [Candidatus Hadarchaeales archaeon]